MPGFMRAIRTPYPRAANALEEVEDILILYWEVYHVVLKEKSLEEEEVREITLREKNGRDNYKL